VRTKERLDSLSFHRLLLLCLPLTSAVVIDCKFKMHTWNVVGDVYSCFLNSDPQITSPNVKITKATGKHINSSMTHASVKYFFTESPSHIINYFPRGLSDVFPNLESIGLNYGRLIEVHQSDLRPFTTLRLLSLWQNNITFLEKDIFKYNTKLELIDVGINKITSIYPTIFDRLTKLTTLHVHSNECISDGRASDKRQSVLALIEEVVKQCSSRAEGLVLDNLAKIDKVEQDLLEFRQRSENHLTAVGRDVKELHKGLEMNISNVIHFMNDEMTRMMSEHVSKNDEDIRNLSSAVVEAIKSLQAEMNQKLTVMQEKLWLHMALLSILLLTVLSVLVTFACLKRGEKKKKKEEERVAGTVEEGVELSKRQEEEP
jgi:hypothetical protein